MPVLVRDDVALRERPALRAKALHVAEEADVEIDLLIERAVERAHRRARGAALRLHLPGEEDRLRGLVARAAPSELVRPVLLDAVHEADDAAVVAGVRVRAGLALGRGLLAVDGRHRAAG